MKPNTKTILLLAATLIPVALFGNTDITSGAFVEVDNLVTSGTASAQKAGGGVLATAFGYIPAIAALGAATATIFYAMKRVDDSNGGKSGLQIAGWGIAGGIGGAVSGIIMVMMLGAFFLGNATNGYTAFQGYWEKAIAGTQAIEAGKFTGTQRSGGTTN